jgi:hypothetical protein
VFFNNTATTRSNCKNKLNLLSIFNIPAIIYLMVDATSPSSFSSLTLPSVQVDQSKDDQKDRRLLKRRDSM